MNSMRCFGTAKELVLMSLQQINGRDPQYPCSQNALHHFEGPPRARRVAVSATCSSEIKFVSSCGLGPRGRGCWIQTRIRCHQPVLDRADNWVLSRVTCGLRSAAFAPNALTRRPELLARPATRGGAFSEIQAQLRVRNATFPLPRSLQRREVEIVGITPNSIRRTGRATLRSF